MGVQTMEIVDNSELNSNQNEKTINGLQKLINELHKEFENDEVCIENVTRIMSSYKSTPAEWKKFAKFDRFRYTRNLVDEGNGKFNLIILCWGEGHGSAIHDHANSHCFMKILKGKLSEVRFEWPESSETTEADSAPRMREIGRTDVSTNEICYINDSLGLHRVENPSHADTAVSLHLYSPPFDACRVFNQQTGKATKAPVTFWSKFGERRNRAIQADRAPEDN